MSVRDTVLWFLPTLATVVMTLSPGRAAAANPAEALPTVGEVLALSSDVLRQKPAVHLRGVVTYFKAEGIPDLVLQDETGGIFVGQGDRDPERGLQSGMVVDVEGTAGPGSFSPRVHAAHLNVVGTNALPAAERVSFDNLKSGRFDCRYVEAAGVVHAATVDRELNRPRLILRIATPAGFFNAWVLRFGDDDGQRYVDSAVRVRGVCLAWENPRRQFTSLRLLVNNLDAITVTRAPPADPFAAVPATPDDLLRYRTDGLNPHRVRLCGVLTWWRPGDYLVIQDAKFGVRVNSDSRAALKLGDTVEVAGFPALMGYSAGLQDAVYRVTGHTGAPVAQPVGVGQLLTDQWAADTDQKLVRLQGTLRAVQRNGWEIILAMEEGGVSFAALLQREENTRWTEQIELGSRLDLTGVCDVRPSDRRRLVGGTPDGFALLLRERRDVVVLRAGPWSNQRRLSVILGVSGGGLLLAVIWAFALRRRVAKRTAQLAREIRSRHDAEAEFAAVQGERDRLAAELHDTVQQTLTGAALQLRAAELAMEKAPDEVRPHVDNARQLLEHSRDELRDAVWDLRAGTSAAETDLAAALREAVASAQTGGERPVAFSLEGEPRAISPTLAHHAARIAQEALTNALRHSGARAVAVTLTFAPHRLRLRLHDNGQGFDTTGAAGPASGHFGLDGMKRRAARAGGTLTIESTATGTTITFEAPLS